MITVTIKHEDKNSNEFGYGLYINGYAEIDDDDYHWFGGELLASERVPFDASDDCIRAAENRVRARTRYHAKKEYAWLD